MKELRVSVSDEVHALVMAQAKVLGVSPARVVSDAIAGTMVLGQRLDGVLDAITEYQSSVEDTSSKVAVIGDFIADLYQAEGMKS